MEHILVVEDDMEIAKIITDFLTAKQYRVNWASTGAEGLKDFKAGSYSLAIVDLMLPEMNGFMLCQNIRLISDIPIIILSAKGQDSDKVKGLKLGADDYMTKPFSLTELEARIESQLNRYRRYDLRGPSANLLEYKNGLSINLETRRVLINHIEANLTLKEYFLLEALALNPGRNVSKKELYMNVWQEMHLDGSNTVTVHIKSLREKLGDTSKSPKFIQTVWGLGYRFIGELIK